MSDVDTTKEAGEGKAPQAAPHRSRATLTVTEPPTVSRPADRGDYFRRGGGRHVQHVQLVNGHPGDGERGKRTMQSVIGMPATQYHALDALSASGAKQLLRSPAHYLTSRASPREPSAAMKLGTLVHALVLEPDSVVQDYAVMPKFDKRSTIGKKAAEEFEQDNVGKSVVDEYTWARARGVAASVLRHPVVSENLRDGTAEVSLLWEQHGVPCKSRADYMTGSAIFDLKTCADASPEGFKRQIASFQYHVQAAHYAAGFREVVGWDLDRFVFIAVETEAPYAVGVYTLDQRSLQSGRLLMERAAEAYKAAQTLAPDAPASYGDDVVEISLPAWAQVDPWQ